jgi:hypothetical protein
MATFLGAFAELRKAAVNSVMSDRPSVCMEKRSSYWTDFHQFLIFRGFQKSVKKIQVSLKSDKNTGYFTRRSSYIFGCILLISS